MSTPTTKTIHLHIPILLALSPAPDQVTSYRYLLHALYDDSASNDVSILDNLILKTLRRVSEYKHRPDGDFTVVLHECIGLPKPVRFTRAACKEAYKLVDSSWLDDNANLLSPKPLLYLEGDVLAVIIHRPLGQICREQIALAAHQRQSPSTGAHLSQRVQTQTTARIDAVYNGRPLDLLGPPITIYHPVFTKFMRVMESPGELTSEELDTAQMFITEAAAYHKDKATRRNRLSSLMSRAVHVDVLNRLHLSNGTCTFVSDGVMLNTCTLPSDLMPLIGVHELKNEIGEDGCDPTAQAENVYVAYYSSAEARSLRELCCCPALLIGSAGPNLQVSGAVFGDQLIVQPLSDSISVIPRPNHRGRSMLDDAGYRVATLFRALRTCLQDLNDYYTELMKASFAVPKMKAVVGVLPVPREFTVARRIVQPPSMIGPHLTSYRDSDGKTVTLTYTQRLEETYAAKALFVAVAQTDSQPMFKVLVKFTPTYNRAAHELLVKISQAPKLHYCEEVESVGLYVVVMDYVNNGEEVQGVLDNPAHIASLEHALATLHAEGWVFGDLRNPNVFLVDDRAVLIDFDWCGKEGEARYPSDILIVKGEWHTGVRRGGLMKQEHDEFHLRLLMGKE